MRVHARLSGPRSRQFLAGLISIAALGLQASPAKINVLFIVIDDLNTALGTYGHPKARTPHIDQLAAQGVRMDHAFVQFPVCGPSRASFMTGRRPEQLGVYQNDVSLFDQNPGILTLPAHFRRHGYTTARIGKVYNHQDNSHPDDWTVLLPTGSRTDQGSRGTTTRIVAGHRHWDVEWTRAEGSDLDQPDGQITRTAIRFLASRTREEKPFFLAVGFHLPHQPLTVPASYFTPYEGLTAPGIYLGDTKHCNMLFDPGGIRVQTQSTPEQRAGYLQAYLAAVGFIDQQVHQLMKVLEESGLKENTLVVLFGDNGFHLGEQGTWGKNTPFEASARVPLILVDPRKPETAGSGYHGLVELIDLAPTLSRLAGLPPMPDVDGVDRSGILTHPDQPGAAQAITQLIRANTLVCSIRTPEFRAIDLGPQAPHGKRHWLFEMTRDPAQARNQIQKHPEAVKDLCEGRVTPLILK